MDVDDAPTDVFEAVRNETRLAILRELVRALGESPFDPWVPYSELREAVGVRDKGNFNYHLDCLSDLLVKSERGYLVSGVGLGVVTLIASGSLDPGWSWGPVEVPGDCQYCDRPVTLRYADGTLYLECGVDDHTLRFPAAPSLLAGHEGSVAERVAVHLYHHFALVRRGICPDCRGPVDGAFRRWAGEFHHYFHGDCDRCGMLHGFTPGMAVLSHPAVVAFFDERGVDVRATPFWALEFCAADAETVVSEDPLRLRVDVERAGDRLSLTLDRTGDVVAVDRPD